MPPCLTHSNIRYVSRVKLSNPGKGVAPSPIPRCSSYWKGSLLVTLDYGHQLYFPGKGVAPSPIPRCSSYWKGSLLVTLEYGHQLYLLFNHYLFGRNGFQSTPSVSPVVSKTRGRMLTKPWMWRSKSVVNLESS